MSKKRLAIAGILLLLTIALVTAAVVWQDRSRRFGQEKQAFVDKYQKAMEIEIHKYFVVCDELPDSPLELVYPGSHTRSPWVFTGMVVYGFNQPTLDEGWEAYEREVFEKTIPRCREKIPEWQNRLTVARKPLVELDGNLDAQLDLFIDADFSQLAGQRFLRGLCEDRGVTEEVILAFTEAYIAVHNIRRMKEMAAELLDSEVVDIAVAGYDAQLGVAMEEFQDAKTAVLEQVE